MQNILKTSRLVLRPFRDTDLTALHGIYSHPDTMRYWERPEHTTLEETRLTLSRLMRDAPEHHLEYAVEREGVLIGRVGMWRPFEVGFILRHDQWGQGFATEAMQALMVELEQRFAEADAFTAELDPRNIGSARVLEKLGFSLDRIADKNFLYGDKEWCDTAYYSRPGKGAAVSASE